MKSMEEALEELSRLQEEARKGGGEDKILQQREKGKLSARERVDSLLDPESFEELDPFARANFGREDMGVLGDGVITGYGKVNGRVVAVYAQDATVKGGSVGAVHRSKIVDTINGALKLRVPLIALNDSSGERFQESLQGRGSIFFSYAQASGVIPLISVILGTCAGNAVYGAALTDFIFAVKGLSHLFVTGPKVIQQVTGEKITLEKLGGAKVHHEVSGTVDFLAENEQEVFLQIRRLLSFLPSNNSEDPPASSTGLEENPLRSQLLRIVPADMKKPYDMHEVILCLVDGEDFLEIKSGFAPNVIVGVGRLGGKVIGIIANQPRFYAGSITVDSSDKMARLIRFCDAFNIPLLFLVDTPAYLPGVNQEHQGIIRHGAKVLFALSEATVPKICVIVRKAFGGGFPAMGCDKRMGTDRVFAWPIVQRATVGAEGAIEVIYRKEIEQSADPEAFKQKKIEEYKEIFYSPYYAASLQLIDRIIDPQETRLQVFRALEILQSKREQRPWKKHNNLPM